MVSNPAKDLLKNPADLRCYLTNELANGRQATSKAINTLCCEAKKITKNRPDSRKCSGNAIRIEAFIDCGEEITQRSSYRKQQIEKRADQSENRLSDHDYCSRNQLKESEYTLERPFNLISGLFAHLKFFGQVAKILREFESLIGCDARKNFTKRLADGVDDSHKALKCIREGFDSDLTTAAICPALKHCVSSLSGIIDHSAKYIRDLGPETFSLFKVTYDKLPSLSPSRLGRFFQGVHKLGKGLNLGSGIGRRITQLENFLDLFVRVALAPKHFFVFLFLSFGHAFSG